LARLTKRNANFQVYQLSNRASAPNPPPTPASVGQPPVLLTEGDKGHTC